MKLGMSKDDIVNYFKKDKESLSYLNNIIKKHPIEFDNFVENLSQIEIKQDNISQEEFRKFALELSIQRLRQLSCFGNPSKEYIEKVFADTIKDIT